ncbi:hypothetical protein [Lentzea kentuckyensis]|uniref:hypothetical protein n=1 Tax=Lentzea kentuckyensis TaxID=360086 RepID=UPI000A37DBAF|nr:hypothetical protein [Lentzea kentuckyensis]
MLPGLGPYVLVGLFLIIFFGCVLLGVLPGGPSLFATGLFAASASICGYSRIDALLAAGMTLLGQIP